MTQKRFLAVRDSWESSLPGKRWDPCRSGHFEHVAGGYSIRKDPSSARGDWTHQGLFFSDWTHWFPCPLTPVWQERAIKVGGTNIF